MRELADDRKDYRARLSYRVTDLEIIGRKLGVRPLSVSADRIGVTAFRCALLLDRLAREHKTEVDRSGQTGRLAEVYPAAALNAWSLPFKGYKGKRGAAVREEIVARIHDALGGGFDDAARDACNASDHALDALVSALIARAVALKQTLKPEGSQLDAAQVEGWIHVPTCSLADLAAAR